MLVISLMEFKLNWKFHKEVLASTLHPSATEIELTELCLTDPICGYGKLITEIRTVKVLC